MVFVFSNVCGSNAGAIQVGATEVGALWLVVEQQEWVAVECVWFKYWSYTSRSYRSRGLGVLGLNNGRGRSGESVIQMLEL